MGGPLGLSIVGGTDHTSHPFGIEDRGVFISKIVPEGAAAKTTLRIGDRILTVSVLCRNVFAIHVYETAPTNIVCTT